jgi:DNA-binding transcriptional MerR regulator
MVTVMTATKAELLKGVLIPERLFFKIGDVAKLVGVEPYVLRYWETEFPMIAPEKSGSGQRVYRRRDVETVVVIKHLLYQERYSIEGARKRIRELRSSGADENKDREQSAKPAVMAPLNPAARGLAKDLKKLSQTPINKLFSL